MLIQIPILFKINLKSRGRTKRNFWICSW